VGGDDEMEVGPVKIKLACLRGGIETWKSGAWRDAWAQKRLNGGKPSRGRTKISAVEQETILSMGSTTG